MMSAMTQEGARLRRAPRTEPKASPRWAGAAGGAANPPRSASGKMRRLRLLLGAPAIVALSWLGAALFAAHAQPSDPLARVTAFYDVLLDTMKQAKSLGTRGRYDRLYPVILRTFDVAGMTRTASGSGWPAATPAQQQALIDAFARMMTATYAARFDDFTGERFEVLQSVPQPSGTIVKTRLVQASGKPVVLNYLMLSTPEGWRIGDVYLEGTISELAARRAEFASVMRSGGSEALAGLLRQRADKLLAQR